MLSKSAESVPNSNPTLGYLFAFIAMLGKSFTSICAKVLTQMANYMVFPFVYSIVLLLFSFGILLYTEDLIHIELYTFTDVIFLSLAALSITFGMITLS